MNRCFLRILVTVVAVSGHVIWSVHSAEGSWFDGMDFEEYHPPDQQGDDAKKILRQTAWRIPCGIMREGTTDVSASEVIPLSTVVDLDLPTSTVHESFLRSKFDKADLSNLVIQDDPTNRTYATIPSGSLWLRMGSTEATVLAPALQVIPEDDSKNGIDPLQNESILLRLGKDFLSKYQGRFDVEGAGGLFIMVNPEEATQKNEVLIPIWQARSPINIHEDL